MSLYISFPNGIAAFYDDRLMPPPEGAVRITRAKYDALLRGQGAGKIITQGESGAPVLVAPVIDLAAVARAQRDQLLAASDWTQIPDAPVDQAAWAAYRLALRDVPEQSGFPTKIVWPTAP